VAWPAPSWRWATWESPMASSGELPVACPPDGSASRAFANPACRQWDAVASSAIDSHAFGCLAKLLVDWPPWLRCTAGPPSLTSATLTTEGCASWHRSVSSTIHMPCSSRPCPPSPPPRWRRALPTPGPGSNRKGAAAAAAAAAPIEESAPLSILCCCLYHLP
jgi:hypothetical protein